MLRKTMIPLALSLLGLLATYSAAAFEVQPMRHSLFPSGGQNTSLLTVKNTRSKALPVEIVVEKRTFGEDSVQTLVDAENDFVVFPFQALIEPGASQAFRFQYVGDQVLAEEAAYSIHVREVPVDLEEGFTGLRYIYSFGVAVYIESQDLESQLTVGTVTRDENILNITLENSGNSFARLTNDRITLSQGDKTVVLEGESLTGIVDAVVIAPNNSLPLKMNLTDLGFAPGEISVSLRETPE